jgi:L-ascorbate metabolism protein UlaG (beta-lactamase superfamily)
MATHDVTLTLIGGPTVLIGIDGFRLLTDPTFDAPGLYTAGAVPLEKTAGPALTPEEVGTVDAVLLSHDQHFDNLDHAGRSFLAKTGATFTTLAGAGRLRGSTTGLAPFATTTLAGADGRRLLITATPARHGPAGIEPMSGDVIGFLIGQEAPGDAIYVTGDTVWYDGTAEVARRYSPKLVVVFAGAAKPRGSFHMTMSTNDVIETAHAFPAARVVAVHNRGWAHFKESAADLAHSFAALKISERLISLEAGKQVALPLG